MSLVPGDLDTDRGPPMTLPLRHFLVGLGWLVLGAVVGVADALGGGRLGPARLHLYLVGWVCLTIMGAMTQFVPVWSGRTLHSRWLAGRQLWLVTVGLAGLAFGFARGRPGLLPVAGALVLAGLWTFVYNVARTLPPPRALDVTERHFALALGYFLVVPAAGLAVALGTAVPAVGFPVPRGRFVAVHATLAVFGAVLTTVVGALYQLGPMFTQTERGGLDVPLQYVEEWCYPLGVLALAGGRLVASPVLARAGGALVLVGLCAFLAVLARHLLGARAERTPMATRYAVALLALLAWVAVTGPAWLGDPLAADVLLGASAPLLLVGGVGFVVVGTLYHVVPFVVWERRYADLLGFEPVPGVDDLYDDRLALADLACLAAGTGLAVAADLGGPPGLGLAGAVVSLAGFLLAATNLLSVVREHGPRSVPALLAGSATSGDDGER